MELRTDNVKWSTKSGNPLTNTWKLEKNGFFTILLTNCVPFVILTMGNRLDSIHIIERRLGSG